MISPQSHTISGAIAKIDALVDILTSEKVFARKLNVELAYHSQYMKPICDQYLEAIGEIEQGTQDSESPPQFFSSTFGTITTLARLRSPDYWVTNLASPVRFCEAVTEMLEAPTRKLQVNGFKSEPHSFKSITD